MPIEKLASGIKRLTDEVVVSGKGSWLHCRSGNSYLDFTTALGVTVLGHSHPNVTKAIKDQADQVHHVMMNVATHQAKLDLVSVLQNIISVNCDHDDKNFFFWNSGSEAVEAAIKLARHVKVGRPNVIAFKGAYHGRTFGAMSLTTSSTIYRSGYSPLMPGVFHTRFPYCVHCSCQRQNSRCCDQWKRDLDELILMQSSASETCAIIVEPILGEGGYVNPPVEFFIYLRAFCDKHDLLLIYDEVQTGFGRTGDMWAYETFSKEASNVNILPDILIFAKGVANGMPLSGICASKSLMDLQPPGSMGGTFGGNPISCAAAVATINTILNENVLDNVKVRSEFIFSRLYDLQSRLKDVIVDVRGKGLMIGIEFDNIKYNGIAKKIVNRCVEQKLLILTAGVYETIRLIPPLNVSDEDVRIGIDIFEKAICHVLSTFYLER